MDSYDFSHCINPTCYKKLSTCWDAYVINRDEVRLGNEAVYRCPYCSSTWKLSDQQINSLQVNNFNLGDDFIVFDIVNSIIVFRVSSNSIIKVDNKNYIHVPSKFFTDNNNKIFSIDGKLTDEEIIFFLKEYNNDKKD